MIQFPFLLPYIGVTMERFRDFAQALQQSGVKDEEDFSIEDYVSSSFGFQS